MEIDLERRAEQDRIFDTWVDHKGRGFALGYTGFGKSYIQMRGAKRYLSKPRKNPAHMVVDSKANKIAWERRFKKERLDVDVFVVNTYSKLPNHKKTKGLLLVDEADKMVTENANSFKRIFDGNPKFVLAVSATWEESEIEFLARRKIFCVGWVDWKQAVENNWASPTKMYNIPVEFSVDEKELYRTYTEDFIRALRMFGSLDGLKEHTKFPVAQAWLKRKQSRGLFKNMDAKQVQGMAFNGFYKMMKRLALSRVCEDKLQTSEILASTLPGKTMVFSTSTDFCDTLADRLGDLGVAYHNKVKVPATEVTQVKVYKGTTKHKQKLAEKFARKKKGDIFVLPETIEVRWTKEIREKKEEYLEGILTSFRSEDGPKVLCCVGKLDRGFDFPDLRNGIIAAGTSSTKDFMQRLGRVVRKKKGKEAIFITLYTKDTQEEKSTQKRQDKLRPGEVENLDSYMELLSRLGLRRKPKIKLS